VAALASLIPGADGTAELGVLVEDAWQRHGIGRQLIARLLATARQITELTATVITQNAAVVSMLRQMPGEFSLTRDRTTISVRIQLHPPARPQPDRPRPLRQATSPAHELKPGHLDRDRTTDRLN
jgi:hypothetical protein